MSSQGRSSRSTTASPSLPSQACTTSWQAGTLEVARAAPAPPVKAWSVHSFHRAWAAWEPSFGGLFPPATTPWKCLSQSAPWNTPPPLWKGSRAHAGK
eukprot:6453227-Pyramimonas_sp.AAC.1